MKFDESTAPEVLEYDFTPWGGSSGVVPEPSDAALQAYLKFYDDLAESDQENREEQLRQEANELTTGSDRPVTVIGTLPEMRSAEGDAVEVELPKRRTLQEMILGDADLARRAVDAVGELCQQSPSADEIWALPTRVRNRFAVWVSNAFVWGDPEGNQPVGTSGSPAGLNGDGGTTSPAAT